MDTPSPCQIRQASLADVPALAPLFDAYRQFYEQAPDRATATRFLTERLTRGESIVLLAEDAQGQALGFCQCYPSFCSVEAAPIWVLYDLFVSPTARRGHVGRQLMQAAEDRARAAGVARLDLTTARDNHRAQALYRSQGWVLDEVFLAFNRSLR